MMSATSVELKGGSNRKMILEDYYSASVRVDTF